MTIPVRHVGDVEELTATFTDEDDTLVDPTTVVLRVLDPSGNTDTYTYALAQITRDSLGVFYKDVTLDEAGEWRYTWTSTGTGSGAEPGQIVVEPLPL
jgi:hypothetical protein